MHGEDALDDTEKWRHSQRFSRAYEREVVKSTQKLAIMPSSRVSSGCSNEDFPVHESSTVNSKQLNTIGL